MTNALWRTQLALVWAYGLAIFCFLFALLGGPHGGTSGSVYDMVYGPLPDGVSVRGSVASPVTWLTAAAMAVAWLAPLAAVALAWSGRRALRSGGDTGDTGLRDRVRAGTLAAAAIAVSYLTPVGWTLVYGLTRWTAMNIWGEGPDAGSLGG
ncbi:hypothetical protein [Dactylosporangium matsuzakiense]|uniref:Uncharacterized protein n=1 Tax=Dactylosporangium matsuzakiense TaxID=53360 RepID=A0A9W6NTS7_9ACTN|nr:hypothetical protein [Dactylosporangium matsuzakiense]UWZ48477.1 hypothetical protein Dmats_19940 [Dactylosporangium matsuzakiense]GLL08532.1 hypothetical protein GCM10017581_102990 [Dactylosporangium matsuzakiense]